MKNIIPLEYLINPDIKSVIPDINFDGVVSDVMDDYVPDNIRPEGKYRFIHPYTSKYTNNIGVPSEKYFNQGDVITGIETKLNVNGIDQDILKTGLPGEIQFIPMAYLEQIDEETNQETNEGGSQNQSNFKTIKVLAVVALVALFIYFIFK